MCLFLLFRLCLNVVAPPRTFRIPISPLSLPGTGILSVLLFPLQSEGNQLCTGGHSLFFFLPWLPHLGSSEPTAIPFQVEYNPLNLKDCFSSSPLLLRCFLSSLLCCCPGPTYGILGTMSGSRGAPLLVGLILRT